MTETIDIHEMKESIVNNENQYIDTLSEAAKTSKETNFSLLYPEFKKSLQDKEQELYSLLKENPMNEENRDIIFDNAITLWNEYKDLVKNTLCIFSLNNLEIRVIDKLLHQTVEYTSETLFYGLHLKKHFLNTLPLVKGDNFNINETDITFSNSVALYHLLSTISVKGLNKENYAFAHILYKLSEISKVYQHYDAISIRLNQAIGQWNLGLSQKNVSELHEEISKEVNK